MKILLDENLPRKLVAALRTEGHEVESVRTLKLPGLENGELYDITRDRGFADSARKSASSERLKLLCVRLSQRRQDEFVVDFVASFREADWAGFQNGDDWP